MHTDYPIQDKRFKYPNFQPSNPKHSSIASPMVFLSVNHLTLSVELTTQAYITIHLSVLLSTRHQRQHKDRPTESFYEINHSDCPTESLYEINKQHTRLAKRPILLHKQPYKISFPFSCISFSSFFCGDHNLYSSHSFRFHTSSF